MKKTVTTALLLLALALVFGHGTLASAAQSPSFETLGELCTELLNTTNGNIKINYEKPVAVTDKQQWMDAINEAKSSLAGSVTLKIKNFDEDIYNLEDIADYNTSVSARGQLLGKNATITYSFTYSPNSRIFAAYKDSSLRAVLTQQELAALMEAYAIVGSLITPDMTDYEKELAIHNYMLAEYSYDEEAARDTQGGSLEAHSVTGLLLNKKGVCEAYANSFMLLCQMAGLECHLATGTMDGVKHQWNIIKLGKEYYNVDLTYNDPVPDIKGRVMYDCLNLSDEELAKTHTIDSSNLPCTGIRYNYYNYNNLNVYNREDMLILVNDKLNRGIREITFKTLGGYNLESSQDLLAATEGRGLNSLYVTGEYGKEGIYYIRFE